MFRTDENDLFGITATYFPHIALHKDEYIEVSDDSSYVSVDDGEGHEAASPEPKPQPRVVGEDTARGDPTPRRHFNDHGHAVASKAVTKRETPSSATTPVDDDESSSTSAPPQMSSPFSKTQQSNARQSELAKNLSTATPITQEKPQVQEFSEDDLSSTVGSSDDFQKTTAKKQQSGADKKEETASERQARIQRLTQAKIASLNPMARKSLAANRSKKRDDEGSETGSSSGLSVSYSSEARKPKKPPIVAADSYLSIT